MHELMHVDTNVMDGVQAHISYVADSQQSHSNEYHTPTVLPPRLPLTDV